MTRLVPMALHFQEPQRISQQVPENPSRSERTWKPNAHHYSTVFDEIRINIIRQSLAA